MTIATIIERVESGERLELTDLEDVMLVVSYLKNTTDSIRGWRMHADSENGLIQVWKEQP